MNTSSYLFVLGIVIGLIGGVITFISPDPITGWIIIAGSFAVIMITTTAWILERETIRPFRRLAMYSSMFTGAFVTSIIFLFFLNTNISGIDPTSVDQLHSASNKQIQRLTLELVREIRIHANSWILDENRQMARTPRVPARPSAEDNKRWSDFQLDIEERGEQWGFSYRSKFGLRVPRLVEEYDQRTGLHTKTPTLGSTDILQHNIPMGPQAEEDLCEYLLKLEQNLPPDINPNESMQHARG